MRKRTRLSANLFVIASAACVIVAWFLTTSTVFAAQIDIRLPLSGGTQFRYSVTVLTNGNIVVADPYSSAVASNAGAVYLCSPTGTLISTLTGSNANDLVGGDLDGYPGGVVVVGGGNFVVFSPNWKNGTAAAAGAATWVSGTQGLSGEVTASNSLVGTTANDQVGVGGVTPLGNGNYVVASPNWNGKLGAATWAGGDTGLSGAVSASNSLVGATANDLVGYDGVTALSNGNYVVRSESWNGGMGAATWANGSMGLAGVVSASNSLVGTTASDNVGYGGVTPLSNGNYVVASDLWNGCVGAATWADGRTGLSGPVAAKNSLVGTTAGDCVGHGGVTALSNGNYVVASPFWTGGVGAATWADGSMGLAGPVTASNSLVGTTANDQVGLHGVTALSNGNYVVASPNWAGMRGAATWGHGKSGLVGPVSKNNSLYGAVNDQIGEKIVALSNGNYVVASSVWNGDVGAATWADGSKSVSAVVSAGNSLVGTTANDYVGDGVAALSNGNYVVSSPRWNGNLGAATWANGSSGLSGAVSASNSLVGTGGEVTALSNGNYVVVDPFWNYSILGGPLGVATWANGSTSLSSMVSASNSLVGTSYGDHLGGGGVTALKDGNYVVSTPDDHGSAGATLASGRFRLKAAIQPWNSVIGGIGSYGLTMTYAYDATRQRLVVGRPAEHIVSLFTMDQIFADNLEP